MYIMLRLVKPRAYLKLSNSLVICLSTMSILSLIWKLHMMLSIPIKMMFPSLGMSSHVAKLCFPPFWQTPVTRRQANAVAHTLASLVTCYCISSCIETIVINEMQWYFLQQKKVIFPDQYYRTTTDCVVFWWHVN